ncbi:iron-sulfur cluster assembly scaffold protein [Dongia sp.]|uniref:iron-sulfur cluster assembly scaffold protein n=1 Tax=Dongia sp. TaxID=1977262 RepID=UPI0035ADB794
MTHALYHEALVAKARSAVGKGRLASPTASARLDNPLCGDRVTIDLDVADGSIGAVGHDVKGCLLCEAAAAAIAEWAPQKSPEVVKEMVNAMRRMMKEGAPAPEPGMAIFTPVQSAKSRRDCVLLPFEALEKALAGLPAGDAS